MLKFFRRRRAHRAEPPVTLSPTDQRIAAWWGYTPAEWVALPDHVRAEKRDMVAQAPGLGAGK